MSLRKRRAHADVFILLRDYLAAVSGQDPPRITSPWTPEEITDSMTGAGPVYGSFVGALTVEDSPLVIAVGVTERQLRKTGQLPITLDSSRRPEPGLARIDHAYTVEEVREMRSKPIPWNPAGPKASVAEQERGWIAHAEARNRPR